MSNYEARPPPASFGDFLAALAEGHDNGGVVVDEGLYEEFFASEGKGASPEFIASLKRPKCLPQSTDGEPASCPVCLQTLAAIETEEEYALASEHYFGDVNALGVRALPCPGKHVVCARCIQAWLRVNNTCPLCRAQLDPDGSAPDAGEQQERQQADRQTERLLALFQSMFGAGGGAATGGPAFGVGLPSVANAARDDGRSAFAGMYS